MSERPYLITVIVPVYNGRSRIKACIDSLVKQTLSPLEIIVVDDASTDETASLVEEFPQDDISIVRLESNQGTHGARRAGIEHAQGEYIGFVDSDDEVDPEMFETLYQRAATEKADMVFCDFKLAYTDGRRIATQHHGSIEAHISRFNSGRAKIIPMRQPTYCNKIFHHSLLERLKESEYTLPGRVVVAEDMADVLVLVYLARRISYVRQPLYTYWQRDKGRYRSMYIENVRTVMVKLAEFFDKYEGDDEEVLRTLHDILFKNLIFPQLVMIHEAVETDIPKKELFELFRSTIIDRLLPNRLARKSQLAYFLLSRPQLANRALRFYRKLKRIVGKT